GLAARNERWCGGALAVPEDQEANSPEPFIVILWSDPGTPVGIAGRHRGGRDRARRVWSAASCCIWAAMACCQRAGQGQGQGSVSARRVEEFPDHGVGPRAAGRWRVRSVERRRGDTVRCAGAGSRWGYERASTPPTPPACREPSASTPATQTRTATRQAPNRSASTHSYLDHSALGQSAGIADREARGAGAGA